MGKRFYLIPFIIFLFCNLARSQTITSTTAGGLFNDTKTWVENIVPTENNDVIINGPVILGAGTVRNLTVNSSGSLEDECCNGRIIRVRGDFTNYGTIKDVYGGVDVEVEGNVRNYGKLLQNNLKFIGTHTKYLQSSTVISCKTIWKYPDGTIKASGPLTFDSTTTIGIAGDTLDMGSFKLTKIQNLSGTHDFQFNGLIYSNGEIDVSGKNVMHSNLAGNFILVGNQPMEFGGGTVFGDLRIAPGKVIWDECCVGRSVTVKGNLINDGIIKDQYSGLEFQVEGDVINNSQMINSSLKLTGTHPQKIGGSAPFGIKTISKVPDGQIIAGNDLVLDTTCTINLWQDTLVMGKYKLTKYGAKKDPAYSNTIWKGLVISYGEIDAGGRFNADLDGNFILTGNTPMEFGENKILSNLVIGKGKEIADECCVGRKLEVLGSIINYGRITKRYGGLDIDAYGDVYNYSKIDNNRIRVISSGGKIPKISGSFECELTFTTLDENSAGKVLITDTLTINKFFRIDKPLVLEVQDGAIFINKAPDFINAGSLNVLGMYSRLAPIYYNEFLKTDETFLKIHGFDMGKCDTVTVVLSNNSPHPQLTSSVKRWWRVIPDNKINSYSLELKYSDDLLNGNDPAALSAYFSSDSGKTWKRISTPINTTRDDVNKTVTVGNETYPVTEQPGDIILSSGGIVSSPSISVSVIGRKQIRVGPPNRYTVSYWNSGDVPTDDFFMTINTQGGVHISSAMFTDPATGNQVNMDIDSLTYDNKDEVLLFVQALSRNEVRNFDVILTADPGTALQKTVVAPVVFAVVYWVGGVLVKKYIKSSIIESCYEMWRPVKDNQSAKEACAEVVVNSMKSAAGKEKPVKIIAEAAGKKIIKDLVGDVIWPITLGKDILGCLGNAVRGMKDYVNGEFEESSKELEKTTSWDPNAKEGPGGYGPNGYMASSAPMTYTIYFENKKEATAPAYKIVVWDTLDQNLFDPGTAAFGKMSHSIGVTSRTGNILKWEFTAIELPPNIYPPEGEGWVQFTVHPKANLPTGTVLKNRATIVFDVNPPLSTNTAVNILDFEAPVTTVTSLTYNEDKGLVNIAWISDDKSGSGINTSTVFMANGDGPYTQACVSDSGKTSIAAQPGQTYKFYVVTQDNVGNTEKNPKEIKQIQTGIDEAKVIPREFQLMQNYPNPFNPVTTIKFTLKEPGHTVLKIYNLLGQVVNVLLDKDLNAGYHKVEFNAGSLASGVYFYHLTQKGNSSARKMMLIK